MSAGPHTASVRLPVEGRLPSFDYPVAIDNDYAVWSAFANQYRPALCFADAQGRIRHHHFGEGEYQQSEVVIQQLLAEAGSVDAGRDMVSVDARDADCISPDCGRRWCTSQDCSQRPLEKEENLWTL
jgi:hypothetical protein